MPLSQELFNEFLLGMIDMARKSGNRIEYQFEPVDDNLSFFSLIVTID